MLRRILLILLFAAAARGQSITPTLARQTAAGVGTCPFTKDVVSGNLLIVSSSWETATGTPTVSDTRSSTWTQIVHNTSNTVRLSVYATVLGSSGADTITFSETSAAFQETTCVEVPPYWGVTTDVISSVTTFSGTPATITTSSLTPTILGDYLYMAVGGFRSAGNFNSNSGELYLGTKNGSDSHGQEAKLSQSTSSQTMSMTNVTNDVGTMVAIAFKPASTIAIVDTALPDGAIGGVYSYTPLCLGGATQTWSLNSGTLQSPLALNTSTGAITGTPVQGGTRSLTLRCSDGTNNADASGIL